ncbi:MAG: Tad domain-containing protein, partial [Nitrospira sp.]|nr:Tad domain-containing protein [Nitrospira sp.]
MLLFLAMVVIGCLALGGLVIDLGMAILTQVQMQAVADPAALEGLRFRDALDGNGQPIGDERRRVAAARMASLVFDDDLDLAAPSVLPLQLGAGPELVLTDHDDPTIAALHASRTIAVPDQRTYLPRLQLNLVNEPHGDLVAGTFVSPWPTAPSREEGNYGRNDFIPSEQVDSAGAPAFLVRLRRANDFDGLDHQEGVSSGGSPIPLLAGHGSMTPFANQDNPNNYNFRAHGFTVRATALADARPALQVGFPQTSVTPPIEGALPFALTLELWNSLPAEQPVILA